jgi:hypothetical protein
MAVSSILSHVRFCIVVFDKVEVCCFDSSFMPSAFRFTLSVLLPILIYKILKKKEYHLV